MRTTGNTLLITGGGSGIGRELARRFHALGNRVIVAGRREAALRETTGGRAGMHALVADMTDAGQIEALARRAVAEHPDLNVLVNNAGVMRREDLSRRRDLSDAEETIVTNLLAPIRLTNALVDHLAGRPDAAVVNVTSGLAFVPMSGAPTYGAAKAGLHSYTVSLRNRLQGRVEVIELAPPAVRTELTPGQSTRQGYMPLHAFIEETMALFLQQPTPPEILVERVRPLRWAERDGTLDQAVARLGAA